MFKKNEKAVSPVIGVILMVAITVVLAAVIAAFVFTMPGTMSKTHLVSVTASQINSTGLVVTYQGGPDHDSVEMMNTTINNVLEDSVEAPSVGYSYTSSNGSINRDHIIVVATFTDNTQQIILDSYV